MARGLELLEKLRRGEIDVSFVVGENGEPGELTTVHLMSDPYVVVSRAEQASTPVVRPADLRRTRPHRRPESTCQRLLDDGLESIGVVPNYVFRSGDNAAIVAMVRAGLGTAIMPSLAVDSTDPRIAVRSIVATDPGSAGLPVLACQSHAVACRGALRRARSGSSAAEKAAAARQPTA